MPEGTSLLASSNHLGPAFTKYTRAVGQLRRHVDLVGDRYSEELEACDNLQPRSRGKTARRAVKSDRKKQKSRLVQSGGDTRMRLSMTR